MKRKQNNFNWKTIAIIFIVLFIVETFFIVWALSIGGEMLDMENECAYNICSMDEAISYYLDDYEEVCYCLDAEGETVHQQFIG